MHYIRDQQANSASSQGCAVWVYMYIGLVNKRVSVKKFVIRNHGCDKSITDHTKMSFCHDSAILASLW